MSAECFGSVVSWQNGRVGGVIPELHPIALTNPEILTTENSSNLRRQKITLKTKDLQLHFQLVR